MTLPARAEPSPSVGALSDIPTEARKLTCCYHALSLELGSGVREEFLAGGWARMEKDDRVGAAGRVGLEAMRWAESSEPGRRRRDATVSRGQRRAARAGSVLLLDARRVQERLYCVQGWWSVEATGRG